MTEVVGIRFKNKSKVYFFDPAGVQLKAGDPVVVETSKGLELGECAKGNYEVPDERIVPPLRCVVRVATENDLSTVENNRKKEADAFEICRKKIAEHGLDMKLVDVEYNFEGNKILFYFTSDGRVDFRELVKDLAGVFRMRIELRQIGVRDEAKMLGGLGICGRPYCCKQFLEDFQPVSTKMAKVQSLSLNPTKISGSCGRLMCCLRYEQEAYEELVKRVPKQGAFVETIDGYGTAVQVNLLRQSVKVRLDGDRDDSLHLYKPNELAAVPGGRPRDGSEPPHVLEYVPEEEEPAEEEPVSEWEDILVEAAAPEPDAVSEKAPAEEKRPSRSRNRRRRGGKKAPGTEGKPAGDAAAKAEKQPEIRHVKAHIEEEPAKEKPADKQNSARSRRRRSGKRPSQEPKAPAVNPPKAEMPKERPAAALSSEGEAKARKNRKRYYSRHRQKGKSGGASAEKQ